MTPYEDARRIVLANMPPPTPATVALDKSVGRVLAEEAHTDRDHPPFNRSAMDGYAVRSADIGDVPATLSVIEEIAAGRTPTQRIGEGQCAKIMTGAPVPEGADTVVMVEHTESSDAAKATILKAPKQGANICPRGEDFRQGDRVFSSGRVIRPQEVAVLAALGLDKVPVYRAPEVAVLSTGSEIVPVDAAVEPCQIRDCNSHSLTVRLARLGIAAELLGIAVDEEEQLRAAIERGLERDVLIVSGGVSMGDYDLVPGMLRDLGVEILLEKVAIKPGKPTVFGKRGDTRVFGLPGNPVSVQVCAELFVLPAIRTMMGYADAGPLVLPVVLEGPLSHKGARRSHIPVTLERDGERLLAAPADYHGSGDIFGLARADALAVLPPVMKKARTGETVDAVILDLDSLG